MKELFIRTLTGILLIVLVIGSILLGSVPFAAILLVIYGLSIYELFHLFQQKSPWQFWLLALCWLTLPLAAFFGLGWTGSSTTYQPLIPLAVISLVWINDTFAYLTGRLIGRHRMTPVLSPKKTWEGLFGGFLFTFIGGWGIFEISGMYNSGIRILLSAAICISGLAGDLFESGLKRKMHVKDSSRLLPGHGGILDRFDSLLFAAPVIWLIIHLLSLYP